jgi:hypothetical protein
MFCRVKKRGDLVENPKINIKQGRDVRYDVNMKD